MDLPLLSVVGEAVLADGAVMMVEGVVVVAGADPARLAPARVECQDDTRPAVSTRSTRVPAPCDGRPEGAARGHRGDVPLVVVTHGSAVPQERLLRLSQRLPYLVSVAVECPEEPYDRVLRPGDVELRFRARSRYDSAGLDLVVEVRSTWTASRETDRQERCDRLRAAVVEDAGTDSVGVHLSLPVAAWSPDD